MGRFSRLGNSLYEGDVSIDFVGRKWLWYGISAVIVAIAAYGLLGKGLNLGVEFEGGTEYSITLPSDQVNQDTADELRVAVAASGLPGTAQPTVTTSGSERIRVQVEKLTSDQAGELGTTLAQAAGVQASDVSTQEIGASWGEQVANRALTGLLVFLGLVVLFIWAYFREWKMSVAALVALAHDLIITVGVYALSGFEVTPSTVTGLLTILGFSLYDTVVVFDKVRENTKSLRQSRRTYAQEANLAVNQTLVRSINTSIVALLPVGAILYVGVFMLGAGSLKDLALSLFVGMAAGLYSSIFIATPLLVHLKSGEKDIADSDRRAKARARRQADRYANVPSAVDDGPVDDRAAAAAGFDSDEVPDDYDERPSGRFQAPAAAPSASGSGRVVPVSKAPLRESGSAGRTQPSRQPRSKRGK